MSRSAEVELDWADSTYRFALKWKQLIELQEQTDAGPFVVLDRLGTGHWRVGDISHVMRLGLIGGGTEPAKALSLVRDYVETRPPLENVMVARGILAVALHGPMDELPGESEAAPTESDLTNSPTESSE